MKNALSIPINEAGVLEDYSSITTGGQKSESTGKDYATVVLNGKYENSTIIYTISMDTNMDIVGLNMNFKNLQRYSGHL